LICGEVISATLAPETIELIAARVPLALGKVRCRYSATKFNIFALKLYFSVLLVIVFG